MQYNISQKFLLLDQDINRITSNMSITDCETVEKALEKTKLEVNHWMRINNVVVIFSDLKNSTGISFDKQKKTMSKLLEYLNKPFIQIHQDFGAEFIDIKGDGGIAIYTEQNAINAILAAVTTKSFYAKNINGKVKTTYDIDFIVETGIAQGSLLLKKIGGRAYSAPVWAGETINKAALISKELKKKNHANNIGITQSLYSLISQDKTLSYYLSKTCGCNNNGIKKTLWTEESLNMHHGEKYYYTNSNWCNIHGQDYINEILTRPIMSSF